MLTEEELKGGFNLGEWEVLPGRGTLRRGDEEIRPEPKVFGVLMSLAKRDNDLVTKQELIDDVWEGRPTADEPIARCVAILRKHLDDRQKPHQYIETMQRRGYRLNQKVELHQPIAPEVTTVFVTESGPSTLLWRVVAAVLIFGFGLIIWYISPPGDLPPARSIAVMPFTNLSGDPSDEYLVRGFKEELLTTLQGLPDYSVKNGRLTYVDLEDDKVAKLLGVASLLYGAIQRSGDKLKVNYRISRHGEVIDGGVVEGGVAELFQLQESVAERVRDHLVGKSAQTLIKSRPSDSEAYDSYIRGMFALEHRGDIGNLENAKSLFENAIRLDAKYGPSYLALATVYALLPNYRNEPPEEMDRHALKTIEDGIAADPKIEDPAGAIYGYVYHKQKRWEESEAAFLRAVNADVVDSNAFNWYSRMLASVGRLDESLAQSLAGLEIDPSSPVLNSRTAMSYAWLMETQKAFEYFERANDLGWNGTIHILGNSFVLIQTGEMQKAQDRAMSALQAAGADSSWVAPLFDAFGDPSKAPVALDAINHASAKGQVLPLVELTARALLGDVDGAMRIAILLEQPGEAFEMDLLFIPELRELRGHPDFLPLLDRLGITRYWRSKGCVWNSDRVSCGTD